MSPYIETFRSSKTPWEVFQAVHAHSHSCFFLDSDGYHPPDQVYSYIGTDPSLEIRLDEKGLHLKGEANGKYSAGKLFPVLKKLLKREKGSDPVNPPFFTGGFVGYFGYEAADLCDKIKFRKKPGPGSPRICLGLYRDVIVYDHQKRIYYLVVNARGTGNGPKTHSSQRAGDRGRPHSFSGKKIKSLDEEREIQKLRKYFERPSVKAKKHFKLKKFAAEMTKGRFQGMVKKAKAYIAAGDIYQANLSQRFSFGYEGSSLELYGKLRAINPSPFACFLKAGDLEVVSSSPERLIQKKGRLCETRPIAGTCPARGSSGQLSEWRERLLQNEKEKAEHLMLVDLERNDLGRVCDYRSVKVEELMTIEKYSHVAHIVSRITGRLQKNKDAFDVIRAMFPGGTITGCPKIRCMQIIDELEPVRRGIYTGSLGYIDLRGDMDLNIVIRTILLKKGRGHLQVGAGIVHDSDPEKEYEETLHKAEALTQSLAAASDCQTLD